MTEDATQRDGPGLIWIQRAGFSVLFDNAAGPAAQEVWRTRVYHDETGQEAILADADALRWPRWVLARLADGRQADGDGKRRGSAAEVEELTVEIVEVRLLDRRAEAADTERARVVVDVRIRGLTPLEQRLGTAVVEEGLGRRVT
jgi:hypothetical protein